MFLSSISRLHFRIINLQLKRYARTGRRNAGDGQTTSAKAENIEPPTLKNDAAHSKPTKPAATSMLDDAVTDFLKVETAEHQDPWSTPPYPPNALLAPQQEQSVHSVRPAVDPRETSIFLFPGQGAQYVGMIKDLLDYPNVIDMFQCASDVLGYNLLKLCTEGPENELNRTIHCQPAIFVTSLAAVEKLKVKEPVAITSCVTAAGFSVGEIAALVFADALSFEAGIKLIKTRAEAMQMASEKAPSGLMSVFIRADSRLDEALTAAKEHMKSKGHPDPVCQIANYLFTKAKVIGGHEMALQYIEDNAEKWNLIRCKRLPVSGAFHTRLMNDAYETLKEEVKSLKIVQPLIPVHNNIDGRIYTSPEMVKRYLAKQVISPVRWEQIMHIIYTRGEGQPFPSTYEMSPGRQLGIMLKNTNAKASKYYVSVDYAKYAE